MRPRCDKCGGRVEYETGRYEVASVRCTACGKLWLRDSEVVMAGIPPAAKGEARREPKGTRRSRRRVRRAAAQNDCGHERIEFRAAEKKPFVCAICGFAWAKASAAARAGVAKRESKAN